MKNHPKKPTKNWRSVKCENCGKQLWKDQWHLKMYPHSYCGHKCQYQSMRGKSVRKDTLLKRKLSLEKRKKTFGYIITPEKRKNFSHSKVGSKNPAWKGGRLRLLGYILIKKSEHPFRDKKGYVREHRLVVEKFLGRYLLPTEHVHHRNGVKDDNRLENLQIVHGSPHNGEVKCPHCSFIFLIR